VDECTEAFYPSQWDALLALSGVRMVRVARGGKPPTTASWCDGCHGWHLTAEPPVQRTIRTAPSRRGSAAATSRPSGRSSVAMTPP